MKNFKLLSKFLQKNSVYPKNVLCNTTQSYFHDCLNAKQNELLTLYYQKKKHLFNYYHNINLDPNTAIQNRVLFLSCESQSTFQKKNNTIYTVEEKINILPHDVDIENKNIIIYLPPSPSISSGLLILTIKEQILLYETSSQGRAFRQCLYTLISKVLFHIDKTKYASLDDFLNRGIKNIFKRIEPTYIPQDLYDVMNERTIPLLQHLIVYIAGTKGFTRNILGSLCDSNISCESYVTSNIPMLTFVELMNLRYIIELFDSSQKGITYHLVNPDGLSSMSREFNPDESKNQTGQMHADILISPKTDVNIAKNTVYNISNNNTPSISMSVDKNNNIDIYIDIKSYVTLGTKERRFAIFHGDYKKFKRYMNDIKTSIQKYITDNKITDTTFIKAYNNIVEITKIKHSPLMLDEIRKNYQNIIDLVIKVSLSSNRDYPNFCPGLAVEAGIDEMFSRKYHEEIKYTLEETSDNPGVVEKLFPPNRVIPEPTRIDNIITILPNIFTPEEIKQIKQALFEWMP